MPSLPNTVRRPWQPAPVKRPYQAPVERTALYDSPTWRRLRKAQLQTHPCCQECERQGLVSPASIADHIIPHRDGSDFFDASNLQSLCKPCHARKSAKEGHQRSYSKRVTDESA
jgi:5-methylcytosine-specific restriction endonuclease McrA